MKPQTKPALKTPPESFARLPFWPRRVVQSQPLEWLHHVLSYRPSAQDQLCHWVWGEKVTAPPRLLLHLPQSSRCCSQLRPSRGLLFCWASSPEHRNFSRPLSPVRYCPTASELGWLHGESLLPVHTTGILPNFCALVAPCLWYAELFEVEKQSLLGCVTSHMHRFWQRENENSKRPGPLEWRGHQDAVFCSRVRTPNGSAGPCPQLCVTPSANHLENSVSLGTDKAWRNGKRNIPYQVLCLVLAQWKTQREKIPIYTMWIWPRTSEPRANLQPQHQLLSLLLGALGPGWPVLPCPGFAPMGGGSLRAQCHEVPAQGSPAHALGKGTREHLFSTVPSRSHRTSTPHLTFFL